MNTELFYKTWKELADKGQLSSRHFYQRAIFKALNATNKANVPVEDIAIALLQKYFTPVTNKTKLANGRTPYDVVTWNKGAYSFARTEQPRILGLDAEKFFETPEEAKAFLDLAKKLDLSKIGRKYLYYVTVQENLTPEQQAVQGAHVVFKLGRNLEIRDNPDNIFFQWIGVPGDRELQQFARKHVPDVTFTETGYEGGTRLTALAYKPILWNKRREFEDYELLSFKNSSGVAEG